MKKLLKWIAIPVAVLILLGLLYLAGSSPAAAAPLLQMTPAVDPMSTPPVAAPPLSAQNGLASTTTISGTMMASGGTCPMMSGSMEMGEMGGMTGMSGGAMGSMGSMSGGAMGSMGSMSGGAMGSMGSMSGSAMGTMQGGVMPMTGVVTMGDALSTTQQGFFYSTNPWWVAGWIVVFALVIALVAFIVLAVIWLVQQIRKGKPAAAA